MVNRETPSLELLKTFVTYIDQKSAAEAATVLGVSQPAVSGHLKRLEDSLPQPPFNTLGRRKHLTPYGKALYDAVKNEISSVERALERVNLQWSDPQSVVLRIGGRREIISRIASFVAFPGEIIFSSMTGPESLLALRHQEIDVAISFTRPDHDDLVATRILTEPIAIACHRDLADRGKSLLELAQQETWLKRTPAIAYKKEPPFIREWVQHLGLTLAHVNIKRICEDWHAVIRMIEGGIGWGFVPSGLIREVVGQDKHLFVQAVPTDIIPEMNLYLVMHRDTKKTPAIAKHLTVKIVSA